MAKFCRVGLLAIAGGALVMLAACGHEDRNAMSWARAALERNGSIEVVAADQESRTFTIRMKDTGELRMVRADDLIAAPASGSQSATASQASASPASPSRAAAGAAPNGATMPVSSAGQGAAASQEASASAQAASAEPEPTVQPSSILPQTASSADASPGKVLESGPGYTIKAAAPQAAVSSGRVRETSVTSATLERRHEPIICQGARLLHIDNRNLAFDGDAVSAEEGCEIHITNSHISAGGVGVLARGANVHIDNSLIEGDQGSIDASQGAQVYVASSRFRGLSRRLDNAAFHDLGGNVWN
jgi:hypothetical protein